MAQFVEKTSFWQFCICPILLICSKTIVKEIQIFLRIFSFSNLFSKTNFLSISVLHSEIVILWMKREVYSDIVRKCFKTREKYSLAVCGSFWGEKQFLLIFVPFYCFEQKGMFTTNPNFLLFRTYSSLLRKKTLSNSVILSELATLW